LQRAPRFCQSRSCNDDKGDEVMRLILAAALLMAFGSAAFAQCYEPPPAPKTSAIPAETTVQPG
jgi:hypothetical protein